jgi:outer membrane protein
MNAKSLKLTTAACVSAVALFAASNAGAYEPGDLMLQLLAAGFAPAASGDTGLDNINYDSGDWSVNPALNITYFFTKNIAAQTVLAVPLARVDLNMDGKSQQATEQWVLPLSIIGQYHLLTEEPISPYLGAGLTYAMFWENSTNLNNIGAGELNVQNTWGGLINFGCNIRIPETNWVAVVDVKKWWLNPARVNINNGPSVDDLTVNPWFFGAGIGYKFSTPALF